MRILVTGAAGFVGSNLVRHLLATSDDEVTGFDALTYSGNLANLHDVAHHPRFRFVHGDVADRAAVAEVMTSHQAVVHLAAETHVDRSIIAPDVFVRTNCTGTNVVCDEARAAAVERFVHVSTDEVYGSIDAGAFTEDDPLRPSSPYSASKAGSDLIALSHHATYGLPVVVTRSSNQFGPYQFPEKLIPYFVTTLLEGGRAPLYGDGLHVRDWMAVGDNCEAIDLLLREGEAGRIYNVAAHQERTNLEVARALVACLGLDEDRIEPVRDRPGHDRRYAVDTTRIESLGWRATTSFDEHLEATVRWYVDNEAWWRPLLERVRNR
jgi:dTDP-glucose 4,6-dehydratase